MSTRSHPPRVVASPCLNALRECIADLRRAPGPGDYEAWRREREQEPQPTAASEEQPFRPSAIVVQTTFGSWSAALTEARRSAPEDASWARRLERRRRFSPHQARA